ncbi:MAG: hypothetical protein EBR02_04045, partial [Alphaproteobacteria bacterium]|nr:hypothetical protein [Alphaproteobacteria bacterium]
MVDSLDNTTAATQASPPAPNAPARPKRSGAVFKHMWQDVLGVATTLVAGLSGAGWSVDASFWKNAKEKKDGFIGPLSKDRDDERRKIFKDLTTEIEKKPSPEALEKLATATRTSLATIEKDYKAAKTS